MSLCFTKMYSVAVLVFCLCQVWGSALRVQVKADSPQLLTLPSNATSIREEIADTFECEGREYGYYADIDNGCQIFHVCLPVQFADGKNTTFRWSFICPEETVFNQEVFTCTREEDSIKCEDSPNFYSLNNHFGTKEDEPVEEDAQTHSEDEQAIPEQTIAEKQPQYIKIIQAQQKEKYSHNHIEYTKNTNEEPLENSDVISVTEVIDENTQRIVLEDEEPMVKQSRMTMKQRAGNLLSPLRSTSQQRQMRRKPRRGFKI